MKLEVRCCCDPNKLLGYIDHPKLQRLGDKWNFAVADRREGDDSFLARMSYTQITLSVDRVGFPNGRIVEAVKNNDYPLAVLRLVPGFEELEPLEFKPLEITPVEQRFIDARRAMMEEICRPKH